MAAEKSKSLVTGNDGKKAYLMKASDWDSNSSPEFGGQSDILELEVGEIAGPLVYIGHTDMTLESGPVRVHQAQTTDGETVRCPIATAFLRSFDQATIEKGDTFAIKRYEDTVKKSGRGKGQNMHIYAVKVLKRATKAE
jgi:hypothetical protein